MTPAISQSCLHKHNLFKQMQSGLITTAVYRTHRNYLSKIIREHKKQYYTEICTKNARTSKIIWEHLNDILGHKVLTNAPKDLDCDVINNFFANLGPSTVVNLSSPKFHYNN